VEVEANVLNDHTVILTTPFFPLVMSDAMESTRFLSRVVYIAFALRHEPEHLPSRATLILSTTGTRIRRLRSSLSDHREGRLGWNYCIRYYEYEYDVMSDDYNKRVVRCAVRELWMAAGLR
jgi:hypothetical protein